MNKNETSELGRIPLAPVQIWLTLRPELKLRVIQLLAHLTVSRLTAKASNDRPQTKQEVSP
jgi:hypothetical protein